MIKANELRLGNAFTSIESDDIYFVMHISKQKTVYGELCLINSFLQEHVFPVPLTEKWLVELGFKRVDDPRRTQIWWHHANSKMEPIQEVKANEYFCYRPIESVHQIQNLFHSITGEELTLTTSETSQ